MDPARATEYLRRSKEILDDVLPIPDDSVSSEIRHQVAMQRGMVQTSIIQLLMSPDPAPSITAPEDVAARLRFLCSKANVDAVIVSDMLFRIGFTFILDASPDFVGIHRAVDQFLKADVIRVLRAKHQEIVKGWDDSRNPLVVSEDGDVSLGHVNDDGSLSTTS